jgi:uncharacterized membrane protein YpjA
MYFFEIVFTSLSLFIYSLLIVLTRRRKVQGLALVGLSILAVLMSFADLTSRNEPIQQRAVYQLMHIGLAIVGLLHVEHQRYSIVALGLILVAASLFLHNQASDYTRGLTFMAGLVALITKQDNETAYALAVAALALTQNKYRDELAYALILLLIYPMMVFLNEKFQAHSLLA